MSVMEKTTSATYHALKHLLENTRRPDGLLPSPWKGVDTEPLYEAMTAFFPAGTPVTAVYPTMRDLGSFKTFTGVVTGAARLDNREPSFHIKDDRGFTILLPGSLLTARAAVSPEVGAETHI